MSGQTYVFVSDIRSGGAHTIHIFSVCFRSHICFAISYMFLLHDICFCYTIIVSAISSLIYKHYKCFVWKHFWNAFEKKQKCLRLVSEKDLWKYSENTWVFISKNILVFTFQILWYLNVKINLEFIFKLFEYLSLKHFFEIERVFSTSVKKEKYFKCFWV